MLPSFSDLVLQAQETVKPYRWLVKQAVCRACGEVHEMKPVLMREVESGWKFETNDDGTHDGAPVVFEQTSLAWCSHCHSPAAQELTKGIRQALDMYANTNTIAIRMRALLIKYEAAQTKDRFHHA